MPTFLYRVKHIQTTFMTIPAIHPRPPHLLWTFLVATILSMRHVTLFWTIANDAVVVVGPDGDKSLHGRRSDKDSSPPSMAPARKNATLMTPLVMPSGNDSVSSV
jgi:hypothetical protein